MNRTTPSPFGGGGSGGDRSKPFSNSIPQNPWANKEELDEFGLGESNPFSVNQGQFPTINDLKPATGGRKNQAIKATTIFMPPPAAEDQREARNQIYMYATLGATILIAFGVVVWKFFLKH